ncbi:hypothetical protein ACXGQW_07455 [Wenyingzhuangia sp. IMCC45533]
MSTEAKKTKIVYKSIQIVSFDVPYPANYGGVIDVLYKLKALSDLEVDITLHTFEYGRGEQPVLEQYCTEVYYYPRNSFNSSFFSTKPYIVKSRDNELLTKRLQQKGGTIIFEGLHTTESLPSLSNCCTVVRVHNIEHNYYKGLYKSESNTFKKLFYLIESFKLKKYESVLNLATHILSISPLEQQYFNQKYQDKSTYIPVFTEMNFTPFEKEENFILWHGDLRVSDNVKSALMAVEVVKNTSYRLIIASSRRSKIIESAIKDLSNVKMNYLEKPNSLAHLFAKTKVNLLFTYQATGIKLKLLNALVKSRFVIANTLMVKQTGLENTCSVCDTVGQVRNELAVLMKVKFTEELRNQRKEALADFDTHVNAKKIMELCAT